MHPKAKKRILLLVGVTSAVFITGGSIYAYRKLSIRQEYATLRTEGLKAHAEGKHVDAVAKLEKYLTRSPNDVEVLSAFAKSRLEVPAAGGRHILNAAAALQRLVGVEQGRTDDQNRLAALLLEMGRIPEALEQADRVLQAKPSEPEALGTRAVALYRLKRTKDAAAAAKKWAEAAPNEPRALLQSLGAAAEDGATPADINTLVDGMMRRCDREMAKAIVRSAVAASNGQRDAAVKEILAAANASDLTESDVRLISAHMESLGMAEQSAAFLASAAEKGLLKGGKLIPARRLMESGRWDLLANLLTNDITDPKTVGYYELRVLRALSMAGTGNLPDAQAVLATMKEDKSKLGVAWAMLLDQALPSPTFQRPEYVITVMTDAMREGESAPLLSLFLADAYVRTGEMERANLIYDDLAKRSAGWSRPLERKAVALASSGQFTAAMDAATEAARRRPRDPGTLTVLGEIWTAAVAAGARNDSAELNNFLSQLSAGLGGDITIAPARVVTLAKSGKKQEANAILADVKQKVKEKPSPTWSPMLLRLASVAATGKLGGELDLVNLAEAQAGITSQSALTRALILASNGDTTTAMSGFEAEYRKADLKGPQASQWLVARARLLSALASNDAGPAWIEVADKYPEDLAIQNEAVSAAEVRRDIEFRRRVIERLKAGTASGFGTWRIAEVRLLLDTGADSREMTRAADDLTEYVRRSPASMDARLLLAICLERVGSTGAAIEQLRTVVRQNPDIRSASLLLAELLQKRGDFSAAGQLLDETLARNIGGSSERRGVASLLANQGEPDRAISVIEADNSRSGPDILLARLYRQRGDLTSAESEIRKVVSATPDIGSLRLMAEILRAQGKTDEAAKTLGRLSELKLEPGVMEMARADYHLKFLEVPQALEAATKATEVAPTNAMAWQTVAMVRAVSGDIDGALTTLDAAAQKIPNNAVIEAQRAQAPILKRAAADPITRPLVAAFMQRPEDSVLLDALKTPTSGAPSEGGPGASLVRVRQLAERYPGVLPVQMLAVRRLMQYGLYAEAGQISARAAQAFPTSAEPAALAASCFASAKDWPQALTYTKLWRNRSTADTLLADLATAEALVNMKRPAEVVELLSPYIQNFSQDPRAFVPALLRTAEAHSIMGRLDTAARLLDPRFSADPTLIVAWISYAHDRLPPELALKWNTLIASRPDASTPDIAWELAKTNATALAKLKDPKAAAARKALADLARSPNHGFGHLMHAALAYDEVDEYPEATSLYDAALTAEPTNVIAKNNLAMLLVRAKGDLARAQRLGEEVITASPNVATFHDTLASVLAARGQYAQAEETVRKAVELEPANAEWWVHLAEIQLLDSRKDAARQTLAGIATIPPDQLPSALRTRLVNAQQSANQRR